MPAFAALPWRKVKTAEYALKSGETFLDGALVLLDGSEDIAEVGSDPAAVLGVAMGKGGDHVDATLQLVALGSETAEFLMSGTIDPVKAHINQDFGVVKDADGIWTVDISETTALVVHIVTIDTLRKLFTVRFLTAVLQNA